LVLWLGVEMALPIFDVVVLPGWSPVWSMQDASWPAESVSMDWMVPARTWDSVPEPEASCHVVSWLPSRPQAGAAAVRRERRQRAARRRAPDGAKESEESPCMTVMPIPHSAVGQAHCAELSAQLEAGGEARHAALAAVRGRVVDFSFDALACRVVQLAISVASRSVAAPLVEELRGHIPACIESPAANYVIQKIIEVMPLSAVQFVSEELEGMGAKTARHRYGCRVLCRLLEHHAGDAGSQGPTARLITEVLDNAVPLCFHAFGHHVVECGIEHGSVEQQHDIALALQENILRACKHRSGTYVLQKALLFCPPRDQQAIAGAILSYPGNLAVLANSCGASVVKTLLQMPQDALGGTAQKIIDASSPHEECKKARRVFRALQSRC